ncbi:rhamnulokinase [Georgenia thermotolerans]|uniref:Rhamnulokinase n=1 Tax=Georgenia thermotolerans TaxID=527326 RepID=A0A7J5UU34_9MICO|nr:rhamnulokinase family protein [Georgenia thermotolerans]KAE8765786.1 rhamnulokinase [Georgenia thermotolerans]
MSTFAAVDLGASSGRVILGRLDDGALVTEEVARFPNAPVAVPAGRRTTLHWDVLRLYDAALAGLRRAARTHGPPATVGIDSWAVDYGLLDADDALLGNPVHYRDRRTAGTPERVFAHVPAPELYARTGVQVQPFNTIFQLAAAAGTAQLAAARRLLLVPDLLGYWLTGVQVAEVTNASTTGLLDPTARAWAPDVAAALRAAFGVPVADLLPPLVEPGTVVGPVRPAGLEGAGAGLDGAALVAVASHDTASAVAAVPAERPDFAYVSCGTWSLVGLELDAPVLTEASRAANFTNELGLDGTVRYLRNVMGLWLLQESARTWAEEQGEDVDLPALVAAAARVPALTCVVDVDDPVFLPPGDMPGRIAAAAAAGGQRPPAGPAETTRCILDSLALAYRRAVRQAAELADREVGVVHLVGGGVRNTLLCQLTADATGLPVVAGPVEGAALGNLLVQARAAGALAGGLPELRAVVAASTVTRRYVPAGDAAAWAAAERRLFAVPA